METWLYHSRVGSAARSDMNGVCALDIELIAARAKLGFPCLQEKPDPHFGFFETPRLR
jgi:hypothetical protein